MAFTQVIARVLDGAAVIDESVRRPVRLTPDGFAGVVYAGAVYPLLSDNVVDISGSSWEIEDCKRFLFAGTVIPYAPRSGAMTTEPGFTGFSGEWDVETNAFGHYVVFNASERVAGQLVDALEEAGLSIHQIITSEGAIVASTVTYLLPVVAIVLGVVVLDETITAITLAGITLVLAGVALTRRRAKPAVDEPQLS